MLKRIMFSAIVIIMLASILGACTPAAPAPATPKAPAAPEGPIRGGVYRSSSLDDAPSFLPYGDTSHRIQNHSAAVFNALVKVNPQKPEVTVANLLPDLAEKWVTSPDGKTITFSLVQGVKFHDGKPFSATDVKYSLDKFRDPKVSAFSSNVASIDNVQIVDANTVKLNLKFPDADLLLFLCSPYCAMLPEHLKNVDPKTTDFLVGTGPFKFVSRVAGKVYTYTRNTDYFKKGLPYLDRYEVYVTGTAELMTDQFIGGRLDTAGTIRQFVEDTNRIKKVRQSAPEAIIAIADNGATRGLIFNMQKDGPWKDIRVRRAMALAFDYEGTIVAGVGGTEPGFIAPAGLVPYYVKEALPQKEVISILGLDKPLAERAVTAKQLMKDAGYPDGFSVTCIVRDSSMHFQPPLFAADIWKKYLNINMKVDVMPSTTLFQKRDKGDFDMYSGSLPPAAGVSVTEFMGIFITDALLNSGKWSNAEYDKLFDQVQREQDQAKRTEAALKAQRIFLNELPYLIFHDSTYGTAVRPDIRIGWPPVTKPVLHPSQSTLATIEVLWWANTPDAKRWIDTQK